MNSLTRSFPPNVHVPPFSRSTVAASATRSGAPLTRVALFEIVKSVTSVSSPLRFNVPLSTSTSLAAASASSVTTPGPLVRCPVPKLFPVGTTAPLLRLYCVAVRVFPPFKSPLELKTSTCSSPPKVQVPPFSRFTVAASATRSAEPLNKVAPVAMVRSVTSVKRPLRFNVPPFTSISSAAASPSKVTVPGPLVSCPDPRLVPAGTSAPLLRLYWSAVKVLPPLSNPLELKAPIVSSPPKVQVPPFSRFTAAPSATRSAEPLNRVASLETVKSVAPVSWPLRFKVPLTTSTCSAAASPFKVTSPGPLSNCPPPRLAPAAVVAPLLRSYCAAVRSPFPFKSPLEVSEPMVSSPPKVQTPPLS